MSDQTHTPQQHYVRPEVNPGSSDEFAAHLQATRGKPPVDPVATASNAELGYVPPQPEHPAVQPHPAASKAATRFGLSG